jgi:hypothetical protein
MRNSLDVELPMNCRRDGGGAGRPRLGAILSTITPRQSLRNKSPSQPQLSSAGPVKSSSGSIGQQQREKRSRRRTVMATTPSSSQQQQPNGKWSALSIHERIRAMNETLDSVEQQQERAPPLTTTSLHSTREGFGGGRRGGVGESQ